MSAGYILNGVVLDPERVRLAGSANAQDGQWTSSAIAGGYDTATVTIEDPEGDLNPNVMQSFLHTESDCAVTRIWTGFVVSAVADRGAYPTGAGCRWTMELVGVNGYPQLRCFDPAVDDVKRPAENNIQRIAWLLGTTAVIGGSELFNDAYVDTSSPQTFDEADYDGQRPVDVLNDLIGPIERNWFIVYNPTDDTQALFYGAVDSGFEDSTIRFSNVRADRDSVTLYPYDDATFTRNGEEIYAAVHVKWRGGSFLRRRTSTAITYTDRHANLSSDRIGRFSTASAWAETFLDAHDSPRETLAWTADIPATQVNLIREGMRCSVKFTFMPGFTDFTWVVIRRRAVMQHPGRRDLYRVRFEASISAVEGQTGGGDPGEFPQEPGCDPDSVVTIQGGVPTITTGGTHGGDGFIEMDEAPGPGNLIFIVTHNFEPVANNKGITDVIGFTAITGEISEPDRGMQCQVWYRIAEEGDDEFIAAESDTGGFGVRCAIAYVEYTGIDTLDDFDVFTVSPDPAGPNPNTLNLGTVTPTAGRVAQLVSFIIPSLDQNDPWGAVNDLVAPMVEDTRYDTVNASRVYIVVGHRTIESTTGSYTPQFDTTYPPGNNLAAWMAGTVTFLCSGEGGACPAAGKWSDWDLIAEGDGVTTDFAVPCPYANETLQVRVDGVDILIGLTETDPTTGDFSLDFAPLAAQGDAPAEQVYARYQGR